MGKQSKKIASYVSHNEVNNAMEKFFADGGKITKIENYSQEILLKREIEDDELDFIDPHAEHPSMNGLGEAGNFLGQEIKALRDEA